jgi:hypothetical protein
MDPKLLTVPVLLGFVFQGIVLSWINKLERKCECSADWRREYTKYFTIVMILYGALRLVSPKMAMMPLVMIPIGLAGLVNLGSILSYIPDLKKKQCDCAIEDEWRDNFIFWWTLLALVVPILAGIFAAFMLARK